MDIPFPALSEPEAQAAVRSAARAVGLAVPEEDLPAVVAHLEVLRTFATGLGDPRPEPAVVFLP